MLPVARVPVHPASVQRAVTACVGLGFTRLTSRLWLVERDAETLTACCELSLFLVTTEVFPRCSLKSMNA